MRTTDKNKRYPIPEFHYEISRNGELWNTNTGRLIRPGSDGRYLLRKQKRMVLVGTPERRKGQMTYDEIMEAL